MQRTQHLTGPLVLLTKALTKSHAMNYTCPLSAKGGWEGVEPPTRFPKGGGLIGSQFLEWGVAVFT